jgi:hypothetical protein
MSRMHYMLFIIKLLDDMQTLSAENEWSQTIERQGRWFQTALQDICSTFPDSDSYKSVTVFFILITIPGFFESTREGDV